MQCSGACADCQQNFQNNSSAENIGKKTEIDIFDKKAITTGGSRTKGSKLVAILAFDMLLKGLKRHTHMRLCICLYEDTTKSPAPYVNLNHMLNPDPNLNLTTKS